MQPSSRPDASHTNSSSCERRREPPLFLLCRTSGRIDPGVNQYARWMTSNAASFYFSGATKDLQLRRGPPPSLTGAEPLNYMIKGCHRESMKATRRYQFPPGGLLWLHLYETARIMDHMCKPSVSVEPDSLHLQPLGEIYPGGAVSRLRDACWCS